VQKYNFLAKGYFFRAVKMISKKHVNKSDLDMYNREVDILKKLNSDFVLRFRDYFDQKIDSHDLGCIVTEHCDVNIQK
jgi:hypothetical protein